MSSAGNSPAGGPSGAAVPAFLRRKQQASNPLVKRKPAATGALRTSTNGVHAPAPPSTNGASKLKPQTQIPTSQAPAEPCERIPIVTTKRQLIEGMRHHVIRFVPNSSQRIQQVDPTAEAQFQRPLRLHRRDPRKTALGNWEQEGTITDDGQQPMDDKEREKLRILKEVRQAEREAIQAQIAPNAAKVKKDRFKHKTEQVFQKAETKQHGVDMRYQETIPWHIEDFEDKNVWQGQYEEPLSNQHVMFLPDTNPDGQKIFRMVPVEKWYKFAPKNLYQTLTIEEAERRMANAGRPSRWFMETQKAQREREAAAPRMSDRMYTRRGKRTEKAAAKGEDDEDMFGGSEGEEGADEMDFDHDEEFQDDDENALFEGDDEDAKEAEAKIKRERNEANIFDVKEQKDWDAEEAAEKERLKKQKKDERKTKKALVKGEKNYIYEDDSDKDEYASETSEDSEEERIKQEEDERKRQEEEAGKVKEEGKLGEKPTTTPPKGNTPSGRLEKKDPLRNKSLKRPGSPNLSETSGNESSSTRKKMKKKHPQKSGLSSGSTLSRATSPSGSASPRSGLNGVARPGGAGSGSEGEGSDNAPLKKQLKLKLKPSGSQAASPVGSRAGSPAAATSPTAKKEPVLPTAEELINVVPPEGLIPSMLLKIFKSAKGHPGLGKFIKTHLRTEQRKTADGKTEMWLFRKGESPRPPA